MKAKVALLSVLLLPAVGTVDSVRQGGNPDRARLDTLRLTGNELFHSRKYTDAIRTYEQGYDTATALGDRHSAARFLANIGSCRFAILQYRQAMRAFLEARQMAESTGDLELTATTSGNISSLYLQMGELNAGVQAAERGLEALRRHGSSEHVADLLAQTALLRARQGDMGTAVALFAEAIDAADGLGDKLYVKASSWELLGYEFLERGQLCEAERAFLESFRLRKLGGLPDLQYSFLDLGMLSLAKGEPAQAARYLTRAIAEASRLPGALPPWRVHHQRGKALMALGRTRQALADFQTSLDSIRRWRVELLPADSFRIGTAVEVQQVYSAFVQAANRLYLHTGDARFARQAFQAAEENRAVSLRALLRGPSAWQEKLPDEYWRILAELRRADVELLREDTPAARQTIGSLLYHLTEMEVSARLDLPSGASPFPHTAGADLIERIKTGLHTHEALLSFHLGEAESWRWVLTNNSFQVRRLPARERVASQAKRFRRAVHLGSTEGVTLGKQLYLELFGDLTADTLRKPRWLLTLDDVLFETPFAALVTGRQGTNPVFLIERHSLEVVPAAAMISSRVGQALEGQFVGVGDPVYNTADPRWPGSEAGASSGQGLFRILPRLLAGPGNAAPVEVARLVGSGREIRACARAWSPDSRKPVFLEGMAASKVRLAQVLTKRSAAVHFATHFLASNRKKDLGAWPEMGSAGPGSRSKPAHEPAERGEALIALSLGPAGEVEVLSPAEISHWRLPLGLVVLSGCGSGLAQTLPGNGLMGLTHAWLAAGAGSVVASLWPAPDDSGGLFGSFYRHLRTGSQRAGNGSTASALRRAQLDMLHSGTWHSLPRYWAAYFSVGKE